MSKGIKSTRIKCMTVLPCGGYSKIYIRVPNTQLMKTINHYMYRYCLTNMYMYSYRKSDQIYSGMIRYTDMAFISFSLWLNLYNLRRWSNHDCNKYYVYFFTTGIDIAIYANDLFVVSAHCYRPAFCVSFLAQPFLHHATYVRWLMSMNIVISGHILKHLSHRY